MSAHGPRTLVLGLGNPLLADDGVGLEVVRRLRDRLSESARLVDIEQDYCGGLRLMERLVGYQRVVIVDAMNTGKLPGTVHQLKVGELPTQHSTCAHDVDLPTALELGRRVGARLPAEADIVLIGVEAADVTTFRQECTTEVAAGIPQAVELVVSLLENWRK